MAEADAPLLELHFAAEVIHWRGPAPFFFARVPAAHVAAVRDAARAASYGWGCVPVAATIGAVAFRTSLFPKDGGYMLPLKAAVRTQADVAPGAAVSVTMRIDPPASRFAG